MVKTVLFPKRDIFAVRYGLQFVCFIVSLYLNKLTVNPCGHLSKNPLLFRPQHRFNHTPI
jgi:hypothetical protein